MEEDRVLFMVSKVHVWLGISHVDDEIADPYDHQYKICKFCR
ncbi:hypothetical protein [Lysinibacillus sp. NPDC056232]